MPLIVERSDFENVVQIAKHCSYDVLQDYILERQEMDLLGLLGNCFYTDVLGNLTNSNYTDFLDGSTFTVECGGKTKTLVHFGLRRVLVHYAYAAYLYRKNFVDTPFNVVIKQSKDSIPASPEQLFKLHNEHRRIAYDYWKMTLEYLCANKDQFMEFDKALCSDCQYSDCDCECGTKGCAKCKGGKSNSNRGYTISVIG